MVVVQRPVLRKALIKFSEEQLVIIGNMVLGANFILFVSNNIILLYVASALFVIGKGLMWPSFMSILSYRAGKIIRELYKDLQVVLEVWRVSLD